VLAPESLAEILENFAQAVREVTEGMKTEKQLFPTPRYHQLDEVRKLHAGTEERRVGRRYLIQQST